MGQVFLIRNKYQVLNYSAKKTYVVTQEALHNLLISKYNRPFPSEVYLEPSETFKMDPSAKIVNY